MRIKKRALSLFLAAALIGTVLPAAAPAAVFAAEDWSAIYTQDFENCDGENLLGDGGLMTPTHTEDSVEFKIASPDGDDTYQNSLSCAANGTDGAGGIIALPEGQNITDGKKYRFKFSLYLVSTDNPGSMPVIGLESSNTELGQYAVLGCVVNGAIRSANIGNSGGNLGKTVSKGSWIDFETVVDMTGSKKTVSYTVKQDGANVLTDIVKDLKNRDNTDFTGELSFSGISVRDKNKDAKVFYFDNLVVEEYVGDPDEPTPTPSVSTPTAPPPSSDALFYVDFEGATRESLVSGYAYDDAGRGDALFAARAADDPHGDSMFFAKGVNGGSGYAFAFNNSSAPNTPGITLSSGVYKFSFSIYPNGDTPVVALDGGSAQTYVPLASVSGGIARHASITDTTSSTVICSGLSNSEWVDFETIVDLDTSRVSYQISQNGQFKGSKTVPLREHLGGEWSGAYAFKRIAIRTRNASQNGFYIDDIKMERWSAAPSIGTDFITFTDALGNQFNPASDHEVSPALDSIKLDFGYAVNDEILNNISISPEADFKVSKQGSACVLTFNEFLAGDTDYKLTIPGLDNGSGGSVFNLNFKTEAEKTLTELRAVNKNGVQVNDISALRPGDKFTVESSVVNMSGSAMNFTVVAAYYNGDRMLATDYYPLTLADGESLRSTEFTVPNEAEGMTSMRCFLWDKMDSLIAYCGYLDIDDVKENEAAQAADIPYTLDYDRTDSKLSVEGVKTDTGYVVLQILKEGKTFETVPQKDDIMYHNQCVTAEGAYSFDVEFADSDEGVHQAVLAASGGSPEREYMTLTLVTPEHFAQLYSDINTAAAAGDADAFAKIINENRAAIGFEFGLTDGKVLSAELTDYMNYVKAHPLDVNLEDDNNRIFKTYMTAYALNNGGIANINEYADQLYFTDQNVLPMYNELAVSDTIQKYFSKRLSDGHVVGLDGFETAFEQALVFTTIRYGDGYGDVKKVLTDYGDTLGITGTAPNTVYSSLLGKDFTGAEALHSEYNSLLGSGNKPSNSSGGGFSGGGGGSFSSVGSTVGYGNTGIDGYVAETLPNENKPQQLTVGFNDIEGVDWAAEAILALADLGIINGTGDGLFEPDNSVTREEFTKILVSAMGLAGSSYADNVFTDVPDDSWYCSFVNIARENGIVQGVGNGEFGAGQTITREDMATMLYNALNLRGVEMSASVPTFNDTAEISDYAKPAVAALYELGAVNGVTETEFSPKETATRAQAAKVVYGVLDHLQ